MPSIVTHYLFSDDVKNNTNEEIQKDIQKANQLYHIFAQSFDNLFYYNLLSFKRGKQIRKFGNTAQKIHVNKYFKNMLLAMKELKLEKNADALAYLYGSLTHYLLDSTCHPFIIYQAGWIDEENPNYEYRGNHELIEVNIDALYWGEKRKTKLYQESLANTLLSKTNFSNELKDLISLTCYNTFHLENMGNIFESSARTGHFIIKYCVTDHYGIKKACAKVFDTIMKKNKLMYQNLSFYIKNPNITFLNREHKKWVHPANCKIESQESFDDLYEKALKKALIIFNLTNKVLKNELDLEEYLKELGNNSYASGMDCRKKIKFRYFQNHSLK